MVSSPASQASRRSWFWRAVGAGIIVYVIVIAGLGSGPAQAFAIEALATGLVVGVIVGVARWVRGGGLGEALFVGALTAFIAHGVEAIRHPGHRR